MPKFLVRNTDGTCEAQDFNQRQLPKGGPAPLSSPGDEIIRTNPFRTDYIRSLLDDARRCMKAAITKISMAVPAVNSKNGSFSGGLSAFSRDSLMALINTHFQVDKTTNPGASLQWLLKIYTTMQSAFLRPGGLWGAFIFDDDPHPEVKQHSQWYAWTYPGGYYQSGAKTGDYRLDTIYLCAGLDGDIQDQNVQTILHELAHFVGPASHGSILDHAYGKVDSFKMKKLTPQQRLHNAESFGNFAFEAGFGRPPKYWYDVDDD